PMVESDMVAMYRRHFEGLGGVVHTDARVEEIAAANGSLVTTFAAAGTRHQISGQVVLRATGRIPYTEGLGLEELRVETDRGRIATVGLGEAEAREKGLEVKVGRFPSAASGRARTLGQTEGAIKVVANASDDTILGVQMVGPRVTDVIAEATLAVQHRLKLQD